MLIREHTGYTLKLYLPENVKMKLLLMQEFIRDFFLHSVLMVPASSRLLYLMIIPPAVMEFLISGDGILEMKQQKLIQAANKILPGSIIPWEIKMFSLLSAPAKAAWIRYQVP